MFRLYEKIKSGQVYFIAEMSANHGGSLDTALQIVREAADAGADCLKIQTYTADSLTIDCNKEPFLIKGGLWDGYKLYDLYTDAATPYEWHQPIKAECEKFGIDFLSTPFDKAAADFLDNLGVEAYKIASFELVDIPLIEYTASMHKPMIISTGMASIDEIQDAVDACRRVGNEQIILLKCCSEYPASWTDMKLLNIPDMMERFKLPIGLSDHSPGGLGAIVGMILGACVIEKHVKIDGVDSADAAFSMTMHEFRYMVENIKAAKLMVSGPDYGLTEGEQSSTVFRRSLFAVKDIKVGEPFTEQNVRSIRPGNGLKPKYCNLLKRRNSKRDISFGEPVTMDDLDVDIAELKKSFYSEMGRIFDEAETDLKIDYKWFRQHIKDSDGLQTVKRLLRKEKPSSRFLDLMKARRPDLTMENIILKPEYEFLFTEEERKKCREWLDEYRDEQ